MTQDVWVSRHSYLEPVAQLHTLVDAAVGGIPNENPCAPILDDYTADFQQGVPLLESAAALIDLTAAANAVLLLIEKLSSVLLSGKLARETRSLDSELRRDPDAPRRAVDWLLDRDEYASAHPGLLRYFGWTVLARSAPILGASDSYLAVAAKHDGGTDEPDAHSAKTRTITSQFSRSKEKEACALTVAKLAAAISKPTMGKEVRTCCWLTGPQFISTSSPVTAD